MNLKWTILAHTGINQPKHRGEIVLFHQIDTHHKHNEHFCPMSHVFSQHKIPQQVQSNHQNLKVTQGNENIQGKGVSIKAKHVHSYKFALSVELYQCPKIREMSQHSPPTQGAFSVQPTLCTLCIFRCSGHLLVFRTLLPATCCKEIRNHFPVRSACPPTQRTKQHSFVRCVNLCSAPEFVNERCVQDHERLRFEWIADLRLNARVVHLISLRPVLVTGVVFLHILVFVQLSNVQRATRARVVPYSRDRNMSLVTWASRTCLQIQLHILCRTTYV